MAESAPEQKQSDVQSREGERPQEAQRELKHLEFFHLAALQAVVLVSMLYGFAKENSGPLKPGVQAVEGAVTSVVGPVYDRFRDVPYELLKFVDRKVDDSLSELERFVPPAVKEASAQACAAAHKVPEVARAVVEEIQRAGVVGTAAGFAKSAVATVEPTAKQLYAKYEPVAEQYAVAAWRALDGVPLFHQVAQIAVPTAAHWSGKYNGAVRYGAENGYAVAAYLPLVPTERIAKVFGARAAGGESSNSDAQ